MNPQSSSSGQTQQSADPVRHQVCILISCFWGYDRDSMSFSDQRRFSESVSEYIGKRFGNEIYPPNVLGYYNNFMPNKMKDGHLPDVWDESTLAISLAFLIKDLKEYDDLTKLSLKDMKGKLSKKAMKDMERVISKMNSDGRKDTVRAAWKIYADILKQKKPILMTTEPDTLAKMAEALGKLGLPPMTAPEQPSPQLGSTLEPSFADSIHETLSMESTIFLQSKDP